MTFRNSITFLSFILLINTTVYSQQATPPNIIVIFIDDMGWGDLSCYGNEDVQTPNIDALAAQGICFDQFYVNSPICSPSRVAITTGNYPQRHRITSFLNNKKSNKKRDMDNWLNPNVSTIASELKKLGYATGHFGKWHMGGQRDVTDAPEITAYGFDQSLTNFEGLGPKLLPLTQSLDPENPEKIIDGKLWKDAEILGGPVTWMQRSKITGGFTNAAIKFIKTSEKSETPFFVNIWPDDIHRPWFSSIKNWNKRKNRYNTVLEEMDVQFKPLFDYIQSSAQLKNNTIILIASDNGCPAKKENGIGGSTGGLRGGKAMLYEGGVRSPLIVWAPQLMDKNKIGIRNTKTVFSAIDIKPSLLSLVNATLSKKWQQNSIDGQDFSKVLLGKSNKKNCTPIYFSRPPDRKAYKGATNLPDLAIRDKDWKFYCDYDGSNAQLYNLKKDLSENNNILKNYPNKVKRYIEQLQKWHQKISPVK